MGDNIDLVRKSPTKQSLGRPGKRWEDSTKKKLAEVGGGGTDSASFPVVGFVISSAKPSCLLLESQYVSSNLLS
jgi:hypothetical protein